MMIAMIWAGAAIIVTATIALAALRGWRGWLDLKRFEIATERDRGTPGPTPAARIEMADIKERLRKLELIARGVDP